MSSLMAYRLEGFINRILLMPQLFLDNEKTMPNPLLATWIQYDSLEKNQIYSSVSQSINTVILGGATARAKWLALSME